MELKTKFSIGDKVAYPRGERSRTTDGESEVIALKVEVTPERTVITYQLSHDIFKEYDESCLKPAKEKQADNNTKVSETKIKS